jgi:hypothetical protein
MSLKVKKLKTKKNKKKKKKNSLGRVFFLKTGFFPTLFSQRHGSADSDPHQNVMDPEHWFPESKINADLDPRHCFNFKGGTRNGLKNVGTYFRSSQREGGICTIKSGTSSKLVRNRLWEAPYSTVYQKGVTE